jgi:hypothetical protein
MTKKENLTSNATNKKELRATFYSVLFIGFCILLFWLVMLFVYLKR